MKIDRCKGCGLYVEIASDHAADCPTRTPTKQSYAIKAAALSRAHLGLLITINRGELQITDMLRGVSHEADLIAERKMSEEVSTYVCGRIETTLTFANAGSVQVAGNDDVTIEAAK